jgi:hypothetical protein
VQESHAPASTRHSNRDPASVAENWKLAVVASVVAAGPLVIVVSGGVVSGGGWIVHVRVAGVGSTLSAGSMARTANVCEPTPRPVYVRGLVHGANTVVSSRHSNVDPGSLALKPNVADVAVVELAGPDVIVVFGGVRSATVHAHSVEPALPAASVARTDKVWAPTARPAYVRGLVHVANAPPSSEHAVIAGSSVEKANDALVAVVVAGGPLVIVTVGGVVSGGGTTAHAHTAEPTLPAPSVARTDTTC